MRKTLEIKKKEPPAQKRYWQIDLCVMESVGGNKRINRKQISAC